MKQVFQSPKTGETKVAEVLTPKVRAGGVLVKNIFSVISGGTEKSIIELSQKNLLQKAVDRPDYVQKFITAVKTKGILAAWETAIAKLDRDIPLGYSTAGKVVEVGERAGEFRVGDMVACAGQDYASHAEYVFIPKNLCVKIPEMVSAEEASFGTLGAIAMQGIRQANLTPGEKVGVVGLGLLGQLAARMLGAYGHSVIGFDPNGMQVKFATENGSEVGVVLGEDNAEAAVQKFTDGRGLDAVIIYASSKTDEPLKLAVSISRDKGRIVQVGMVPSNIPWRDFFAKELSYVPSRSYGPGRYDKNYEEGGQDYPLGYVRWTEKRNMEEFLNLLSDKRISVKNLITKVYPIAEAEKAYEYIFSPEGLTHGVLLSYPENSERQSIQKISTAVANSGKKSGEISIGLVGLGSFMVGTILPELKKFKSIKIRAICNAQGFPAKKIAERVSAEYITTEYSKLLDDKSLDLIICATRHSAHAGMVKQALLADKNIYVEKPLALNQAELDEIMEAAKNSKGRLFVGFNRRFSRHLIEAKKEFSNSQTPLMMMFRVNAGPVEASHWTQSAKEGGRIVGEGCHFVDALQYVIGSEPKRLWVGGVPVGGAVKSEDNYSLTIEYANGSVGTIIYSSIGNFRLPKEYVEIYGEGKVMSIDNFKDAKIVYPGKSKKINLWHQDKGYHGELAALLASIREGKPSPVSLAELYNSHLAIFKAAESFKSGGVIEFDVEKN